MNDYTKLGKISGFFGVKGWVKIFSYTRPRSGICKYQNLYYGDSKKKITFTEIKESAKHIIAHIENIDDRDDAQVFQGQFLYMLQNDLPRLDNEYYWHELIGLTVINQSGVALGAVHEMMETGANDVIVVRNTHNEEILIPYVFSHFVQSVNLDDKTIIVDWEDS